jgi:hypothetical protein
MGIFNNTFRTHIVDELNHRKTQKGRQEVYHPTARVTALVQGDLEGEQLKGFTLGVPDTSLVTSIEDLMNTDGLGSVVGITYNESQPRKVVIGKIKNLPTPGVTNITISTQSKGGLVFKATVDFKFYGKEQYNFIYQTFMRPGNPILIEYGHTRTDETLKNLDFFKNLETDFISEITDDIRQISRLQSTRTKGAVSGLVSNFKISLNENNEYEASIDIINALEFLYTLSPQDTFLNYDDPELSNSIKNNFGALDNEDSDKYDPRYDRVFSKVEIDALGVSQDHPNIEEVSPPPSFKKSILFSNEVSFTKERRWWWDGNGVISTEDMGDFTWLSLDYILNELLPVILKETIKIEHNKILTSIILTPNQIRDESRYEWYNGRLTEHIGEGSRLREDTLRKYNQELFDSMQEFKNIMVMYEPIKYWRNLRSTNMKNVIINNENLYDPEFFRVQITNSYKQKFAIEDGDEHKLNNFYKVNPLWRDKELYGSNKIGEERTSVQGIFVNYQVVRKAFINSNSVSEAIVRILNIINSSTNGILNLKLKNISTDKLKGDEFYESYDLVIYDENSLPYKEEILDIYTFFEDDLSEAISYDFDFSLPASVASTVIANNFKEKTNDMVGEAESNHLIRSGYLINRDTGEYLIQSMIPSDTKDTSTQNFRLARTPVQIYEESRRRLGEEQSDNEEDRPDRVEEQLDRIGNKFSSMVGYQELVPPAMKSNVIKSGLFNTLPTSAKISIKLNGIDGFRFGDMFSVRNMLPTPYDENNIFMLTGYKHDIDSDGWFTTIDGIMVASTQKEDRLFTTISTRLSPERKQLIMDARGSVINTDERIRNLPPDKDLSTINPLLREIVEEVRNRLPTLEGFDDLNSPRLVMRVISARRSVEENRRVGGAENSRHVTGHAVDIQLYERIVVIAAGGRPSYRYRVLWKPRFIDAGNDPYRRKQQAAYTAVGRLFREVARDKGIGGLRWGAPREWGGDFSIVDPNHFDIPQSIPNDSYLLGGSTLQSSGD